jgi:hypothetical protein
MAEFRGVEMTGSTFFGLADRCWRVLEPVHAITYFADESLKEAAAVGLKGFWMPYFAFRAAPVRDVPLEAL